MNLENQSPGRTTKTLHNYGGPLLLIGILLEILIWLRSKRSSAGAEVRFSSCLMVHNIRFSVVDERVVVLGIPESVGEREATKKGYTIPSEGLAILLKNYFHDRQKQSSLKEYIQEVIEQTGATLEHLAREFHLDEKDLKELAR